MATLPQNHLIVFVKAPIPGKVKTRLARDLGEGPACEAYVRLVEALLARLAGLACFEFRYTPDTDAALCQRWARPSIRLRAQGPGDLGQRLQRAFTDAFAHGAQRVVIIGSDCPYVTLTDIESAWRALSHSDAVFGPAMDGGYWLVGLTKPIPQLFEHIGWSQPDTLDQTLQVARKLGLRTLLLNPLEDVDTLDEWRRFEAAGA